MLQNILWCLLQEKLLFEIQSNDEDHPLRPAAHKHTVVKLELGPVWSGVLWLLTVLLLCGNA